MKENREGVVVVAVSVWMNVRITWNRMGESTRNKDEQGCMGSQGEGGETGVEVMGIGGSSSKERSRAQLRNWIYPSFARPLSLSFLSFS